MTEQRHLMIAKLEDGNFIVVSPFKPRFCVGGATEDEARRKAEAAFAFHDCCSRLIPAANPSRERIGKPDYTVSRLQS